MSAGPVGQQGMPGFGGADGPRPVRNPAGAGWVIAYPMAGCPGLRRYGANRYRTEAACRGAISRGALATCGEARVVSAYETAARSARVGRAP